MVQFRQSGADRTAEELIRASDESREKVSQVVKRGATNIKREMRNDAKSDGSYQHFHRSISYDLLDGGLEAEIGPDKEKTQGALGNILYFGTSNNAPVLDLNRPLEAEEPKFGQHMERVLREVLP